MHKSFRRRHEVAKMAGADADALVASDRNQLA